MFDSRNRRSRRLGLRIGVAATMIVGSIGLTAGPVSAAPSGLDSTFDTDGYNVADLPGTSLARDAASQSTGASRSLVVATSSINEVNTSYALAYTNTGAQDADYGSGTGGNAGRVAITVPDADTVTANSVAVAGSEAFYAGSSQEDEAISGFISKFDTNGDPEIGFSSDGVLPVPDALDIGWVGVTTGGKVVALGSDTDGAAAIWQFNADGTPFNSFGTAGKFLLSNFDDEGVLSSVTSSGDTLWVAGVQDDGSALINKVDLSPSATPAVVNKALTGVVPSVDGVSDLVAGASGTVYFGGRVEQKAAVTQLDSSLNKVASFGDNGSVLVDGAELAGASLYNSVSGLGVQNGRVVANITTNDVQVSGQSANVTPVDSSVARLTSYGAPDLSFDSADTQNRNGISTLSFGQDTVAQTAPVVVKSNAAFQVAGARTDAQNNVDPVLAQVGDGSTPAASAIPQAPTSVTATDQAGAAVKVDWTVPASDGGSTITGYSIQRLVNGQPVGAPVAVTGATASTATFTIPNVESGPAQSFRVFATNTNGNGYSSVASAPITVNGPPSVPQRVAAIAQGGGKIKVQWEAPANNGGSAVTGYDVEFADGSSSQAKDDDEFSHEFTGLTPGQQYQFQVRATNAEGDGSFAQSNKSYEAGSNTDAGYYLFGRDGGVLAYGNAPNYGNATQFPHQPIVDGELTASGQGYWMTAQDGGVFAFGDAVYRGGRGGQPLNGPIVGMSSSSTGAGYYLVANDGGIFAYGDAQFRGSMGGQPLNKPMVDMFTAPGGDGYWQVASDGGIFSYNTQFYGSMGGQYLFRPIVGAATTPSGKGYWLVASDGGVFAFGDAVYYGSTGGQNLNAPVTGIVPTSSGKGYNLIAADGGVFSYGDAVNRGSAGGTPLNQPVVGGVRN